MKSVLAEERTSLKTKTTKTKSRAIAPDEFLTTRELMRLLKIKHKQTVYALINDGLPAIIVGKSYRFIKDEIIGFLRNRKNNRHVRHYSGRR